jgi:hypothetical protein
MADRVFERIMNQTAADVESKQEDLDPEERKRRMQARRTPAATLPHPLSTCTASSA